MQYGHLRIEHLYTDLKALIRAREHNPIFEHKTGYIWSVEQGRGRGFHIHAAFFFNGAHVRSDWHKANQIGALWEKISAGRGYCYNCNADKGKYATPGIGTINRSDGQACSNVVKAMCYLAKCSGLMKPDTHLGENARQIEVSDDQTTPCFFR